LSQIRFRRGNSQLSGDDLAALHARETLVAAEQPNISGGGIALSIDLEGGPGGLVGYRAKHHTGLIDVDRKAAYAVTDFSEPLYTYGPRVLVLYPHKFQILVSRAAGHVPPSHAAETSPFDSLVGEFRNHYACI